MTITITPARRLLLLDVHAGVVERQAGAWWHLRTGHRVTAQLIPLINAGLVQVQPHPIHVTRRVARLTRAGWHEIKEEVQP